MFAVRHDEIMIIFLGNNDEGGRIRILCGKEVSDFTKCFLMPAAIARQTANHRIQKTEYPHGVTGLTITLVNSPMSEAHFASFRDSIIRALGSHCAYTFTGAGSNTASRQTTPAVV